MRVCVCIVVVVSREETIVDVNAALLIIYYPNFLINNDARLLFITACLYTTPLWQSTWHIRVLYTCTHALNSLSLSLLNQSNYACMTFVSSYRIIVALLPVKNVNTRTHKRYKLSGGCCLCSFSNAYIHTYLDDWRGFFLVMEKRVEREKESRVRTSHYRRSYSCLHSICCCCLRVCIIDG